VRCIMLYCHVIAVAVVTGSPLWSADVSSSGEQCQVRLVTSCELFTVLTSNPTHSIPLCSLFLVLHYCFCSSGLAMWTWASSNLFDWVYMKRCMPFFSSSPGKQSRCSPRLRGENDDWHVLQIQKAPLQVQL
jgi:hypothetical protein